VSLIYWRDLYKTDINNKVIVSLRLIKVTLVSIVQKLPFSLPPITVTVAAAFLVALIMGFIVGIPLRRALSIALEVTPENHRFLVFHALFALGIYSPLAIMFPTITPTAGRLQFIARLPLSQSILGFCLISPVAVALVLLMLVIMPGFVMVSVASLHLSYLNALLALLAVSAVSFMHAQLTYVLGSNLAVRYNTLGLNISTSNQIFTFGYAALLIFIIRESFLGDYSPYGDFVNAVLMLFQWPLMSATAIKFSLWFPLIPIVIFILAGISFIALLPYTLVPRITAGFGIGGRFLSRLLPSFPYAVLFLRFLRAPRSRETVHILTLVITIITTITFFAPRPLQYGLSEQLIFVLAVFAGSLSSLWSSLTTSSVESYEFQVGLSPQKVRAITLVFSLIYAIGYSLTIGAIVLSILNQPLILFSKLVIASIISGLVGYLYGALALSRSYYRAPMDGFPLFICGFALSGIGALSDKVGYPIGSLMSGIAVTGILMAVLLVVFALPRYNTRSKMHLKYEL